MEDPSVVGKKYPTVPMPSTFNSDAMPEIDVFWTGRIGEMKSCTHAVQELLAPVSNRSW